MRNRPVPCLLTSLYCLFALVITSPFLSCSTAEAPPLTTQPAISKSPAVPTTEQQPEENMTADAATILARPQVPILCYHQIRDYRPGDSKTAKDYIVPVNDFAAQIKSLADSGFHSIQPDELHDYLVKGKPLPAKPVMITFDDTRLDQFTNALPELDKYGFKGVFFIMTVSLGKPGYMSREQVKQLSDAGHTIGSHTYDHKNVKKYEGKDWDEQVAKPSKQLTEITGKPIHYFAYPFGLWNKEGIPHLKEHGFKAVFQLAANMDGNDPLFSVRRIIVPGGWSGTTLQRVMKNSFASKTR